MGKKEEKQKQAILRTICYSRVFDFPPTEKELQRFLIGQKASLEEVKAALSRLPKNCPNFPPPATPSSASGGHGGRGKSPNSRLLAQKKRALAKKRIWPLKLLPDVRAVFLTGDIAAGAAKETSDLDLMLVVKKGTISRVRFLASFLYSVLGWRRSRFSPNHPKTSVCFNVFLEEDTLAMPKEKRNLFVAHEVAFAKPLFDRGGVHQRFLWENRWALRFLPNAFKVDGSVSYHPGQASMTGKQLFLHRRDLTDEVLSLYNRYCKEVDVPPVVLGRIRRSRRRHQNPFPREKTDSGQARVTHSTKF